MDSGAGLAASRATDAQTASPFRSCLRTAAAADAPARPQRLGQPNADLTTAPTGPRVILDVETGVVREGIVSNNSTR